MIGIAYDSKVELIWNTNTETDLAGYGVYMKEADGEFTEVKDLVVGNRYVVENLTNDIQYEFYVKAKDVNGNVSEESNIVQAKPIDMTPPQVPTGLVLLSNSPSIGVKFQWTPNTETDLAGYYVYKNGVKLPTLLTTSVFEDTAVLEKTEYMYEVTAVDNKGNESNRSTALYVLTADETAPSKPTGVQAILSGTEVVIQWNENTEDDVVGYNVYRNGVKINETLIAVPAFVDSNVTEKYSYVYQVTAVDTSGNESIKSDSVSVSIPDMTAPERPENIVVTLNNKNAELMWSASVSDDVEKYEIYRSQDGLNFTIIAETTETVYVDENLPEKMTFHYYVRAVDTAGLKSAHSDTVVVIIPDTTAPDAPTELTFTNENEVVTLSWVGSDSNDVVGYRIYKMYDAVIETIDTTETTYVDTVEFNKEYTYYVVAVDDSNNSSEPSNQIIVLVTEPEQP
ncbi:MAG: hypothetical protein N2043_02110 [Ignavibacterium sp.]|nr:hypothetical protein [Ignavibacterium sp.]